MKACALILNQTIWARYNAVVGNGAIGEYGIEFVIGCALDEVLRSAPATSWGDVQARIAYIEADMLENEDDPARIVQVRQIGTDVARMSKV